MHSCRILHSGLLRGVFGFSVSVCSGCINSRQVTLYLEADSWFRTDLSSIGKLRKYAGRLGNISLGGATSISTPASRLSRKRCVSRAKMHGSYVAARMIFSPPCRFLQSFTNKTHPSHAFDNFPAPNPHTHRNILIRLSNSRRLASNSPSHTDMILLSTSVANIWLSRNRLRNGRWCCC